MVPNKGLFLDCDPIDQPKGTWRDARNIMYDFKKGLLTSDIGTAPIIALEYPYTVAKPIGVTPFPDGSFVIYSDGIEGGKDRLGVVNKDTEYVDLIIDDILNFDYLFPILSSEFDYNYLQQRIVTWTDFNNKTKIVNIDSLPFLLNVDKSLANPDHYSNADIFPSFTSPEATFGILNNGGAVPSGAYSFCIAYKDKDGTRTANTPPQGKVYIVEDTTTVSNNHDGSVPGQLTSKGIQIAFSHLDTNYSSFILIGISVINGIRTAFEIKEVGFSHSTIVTTYLGTENITTMDLEEVLTPRPVYTKSRAMTKINNVLYHGNLETEEDIDFQSAANNIRLFYTSKLVSVTNVTLPNTPTFSHGEVYAFYIVFVLNNGSFSKAFHIPGRIPYGGESPSPTAAITVGQSGATVSGKRYQIEDTTNKGGHVYEITVDGTRRASSLSSNTNMGYWVNQDEVYSSNFPGGLAGQNVRHHVFPTLRKCKDTHYPSDVDYLKSKMDILGLDVTNLAFSDDLKSKVSGWYITYAKKTYADSINYGQDILLYSSKINSGGGNQANRYDSIGNAQTTFDTFAGLTPVFDQIRGHNVDLLYDKPALSTSGLFIVPEARYRYYGTKTASANPNGDFILATNPNMVYLFDYINRPEGLTSSAVAVDHPSPTVGIPVRVDEFKYLPNGVADGDLVNTKSGESIHMKFPVSFKPSGFSYKQWSSAGGAFAVHTTLVEGTPLNPSDFIEETYLYTLKQVKTNVHAIVTDQELIKVDTFVAAGPDIATPINVRQLISGDRFVSPRTVMRLGATSPNITVDDERGLTIRYHVCESRVNFRYRYEVAGNENTKYYPKTAAASFVVYTDNPRRIQFGYGANTQDLSGYKSDYNSLNDFNQPLIFGTSVFTTNKFPFRVIRSGVAGTNQDGINSWKTYLAADIYERNRSKGEIINLAALDDVLLIHHKYGLFRTVGNNTLNFNTTEVYLGSGDIFSQEPKDPIPSQLGYLGTQNSLSCCSFKGGYAWVNQMLGKVFLLTAGGVIEISNLGLYNHFRDNLQINGLNLPEQPLTDEGGVLMTFDPEYKRLILVKKTGSLEFNNWEDAFTLSYSIENNFWVSFHDFYPSVIFNNNLQLIAVSGVNNRLYPFVDTGGNRADYLGLGPKPSSIDIVYNDNPKDNKIFFNTNWISQGYLGKAITKTNKTLTSIRCKTDNQDTGEVDLVQFTEFGVAHNTRAERNTWHFNKIKDNNVDVFKRKPLVGNYMVVTYKTDNILISEVEQNYLYLYDLSAKFRKAEI